MIYYSYTTGMIICSHCDLHEQLWVPVTRNQSSAHHSSPLDSGCGVMSEEAETATGAVAFWAHALLAAGTKGSCTSEAA